DGLVHLPAADLAVWKIAVAERYAAHVQAFQFLGLEALADNKLGAAAADINHQPFTGIVRQGVGYPQIDQAGFFPAGNYFHRITQDVRRPGNKLVGVACHPQGVGADNLHPRSEEHTSELQSRENLVCRLLLEKKKKKKHKE